MKKFLLITFSDTGYDSRILRYIKILNEKYELFVIGNGKLNLKNIKYINLNYSFKRKNKNIFEFFYYYFYLKFKLFFIINQIKPSFIHANDFETFLPSYLSSIRKRIIYDSHEIWCKRDGVERNFFTRFINFFDYVFERKIIKKIKYVITVSDSIKKYFEKNYNLKNVYVIRNLPENDLNQNCDEYIKENIKNEKRIKFVYIGPLNNERNIDFLYEIFKNYTDSFHLTLIGENHIGLKNTPNIKIFGQIEENKVIPTLKLFDVGIHPMRTDNLNHIYSLPNKIFQYMAASLVLFIFRNDETSKIVERFKNGFLADFSDKDEVLKILEKFKNLDLENFKKNSLNAFLNEYNWEKEKKVYLKILKNL